MLRCFVASTMLMLVLAGCGKDDVSEDGLDPTAQSAAEVLKSNIAEITALLPLDEDNDPNDLIGRPNGYQAAIVLYDSRVSCPTDEPGVNCGATIEQWPSKDAAEKRAAYIRSVQSGNSLLGSEWDTVRDNLLLRVSGDMKPSDAERYEELFMSEDLAGGDVAESNALPESTEPSSPVDDEPFTLQDSGFGFQYGYAWVISRVRNDDDHAGQTVTVNFNLRDSNGKLIASGSQVSHFSWPGQVLPVATQVDVPKGKRPSRIEATVLVEDNGVFDDQVSADWGTIRGRIYRPEYSDSFGARFEVKNPTSTQLSGAALQVVCTSKAGKIIGGGVEFPELIPASGSVIVEVESLYTRMKPARCTGYLAPWM